jgi:hypothetical protein
MLQTLKRKSSLLSNLWVRTGLVFLLAMGVYWTTFWLADTRHTPNLSYFNYLAESFLHGRLDLPREAGNYDLTSYAGRWYVPFPPLPAILLLPWVAWQGAKNTNVAYFSIFVGAINVSLVFLFLEALTRRGWTSLSTRYNLALTLLFGLGSVHWYLSIMGEVWFVSQICTITFVILAAWVAVANGSPWLSGAMLALAMLGRPTIVCSWPLLLGIAAQLSKDQNQHHKINWRQLCRWAIVSVMPLIAAIAALLVYNYLRFNNLTDFGYLSENVNPDLRRALSIYGQFNLYYLSSNVEAMLLDLPNINLATMSIEPDLHGMSLLLTMPSLIYIVRAWRASPLTIGAWVALGLLLIPLLTYYNTGWAQFGYRFSLDFILPIITLLAIGAKQRLSWLMLGMILWGIVINAWGSYWFITTQFH